MSCPGTVLPRHHLRWEIGRRAVGGVKKGPSSIGTTTQDDWPLRFLWEYLKSLPRYCCEYSVCSPISTVAVGSEDKCCGLRASGFPGDHEPGPSRSLMIVVRNLAAAVAAAAAAAQQQHSSPHTQCPWHCTQLGVPEPRPRPTKNDIASSIASRRQGSNEKKKMTHSDRGARLSTSKSPSPTEPRVTRLALSHKLPWPSRPVSIGWRRQPVP